MIKITILSLLLISTCFSKSVSVTSKSKVVASNDSSVPALQSPYEEFQKFQSLHGRNYGAEETLAKYKTFQANHDLIANHNNNHHKNGKGNSSVFLGHNKFSDLSNDEFRERHHGYVPRNQSNATNASNDSSEDSGFLNKGKGRVLAAPASVDWRNNGAVNSVKD